MKKYLFFTAILLTIYFMVAAFNTADFDLWHRLAAGKLFFKLGHVPQTDIFAYTQTKDLWIDHEWGSGVIFYFIENNFGLAGLSFLKLVLLFATFLPVFLMNRLRTEEPGKYRILFYIIFLYTILFGFLYTIRSHCFTYAFFAWWIYLIELVKRGNRKLLWLFPPMTVIWANLHGGFLAGLGLLLMSGFPVTAAISGLFTIINPYGIKYWEYLTGAVTMERTFIPEWQPLDLFGPFNIALGFKIFLLMTIIALPHIFKNKKWSELLILAVTCYLSLKHIRHNVFFVIASAAYMGEYFFPKKIFPRLEFFKDVLIYSIIFIVGILTVHFVPLKLKTDTFPVKSVKFIKKNNLSGNLLVLFNWGGYALWNLYPQCLVSIDGRYEEVYPESLVNESARFHYVGKDWKDLMNKYKTDLMLIDTSYPVFQELLTHDDWKVIYQDKISAVFMPTSKAIYFKNASEIPSIKN
ncbi:MAG: hypothetical protein A2Y25_06985 [Candidatus Melainabacteria bacterium GWF2_37_15]|nr:MAG: hypothetical protein A2Y25_06985 [Candidatus Melainabacteria bacterium GWF2_37_15]